MRYCLTTETHSQPQTESAHGMIIFFLSQNVTSTFYNTCQSFDIPPLISDELWWNKMTHIHNLAMNSFSTDFAYIWSQTWICVFILNNCATYCFYLHGSYITTYIANISLVWRRMGCGNTKYVLPSVVGQMWGMEWHGSCPSTVKACGQRRGRSKESKNMRYLPVTVNMDRDMY